MEPEKQFPLFVSFAPAKRSEFILHEKNVMFIPFSDGIVRLRLVHAFLLTYVSQARPFSDFPGQPSGLHGTLFSQSLFEVP